MQHRCTFFLWHLLCIHFMQTWWIFSFFCFEIIGWRVGKCTVQNFLSNRLKLTFLLTNIYTLHLLSLSFKFFQPLSLYRTEFKDCLTCKSLKELPSATLLRSKRALDLQVLMARTCTLHGENQSQTVFAIHVDHLKGHDLCAVFDHKPFKFVVPYHVFLSFSLQDS